MGSRVRVPSGPLLKIKVLVALEVAGIFLYLGHETNNHTGAGTSPRWVRITTLVLHFFMRQIRVTMRDRESPILLSVLVFLILTRILRLTTSSLIALVSARPLLGSGLPSIVTEFDTLLAFGKLFRKRV